MPQVRPLFGKSPRWHYERFPPNDVITGMVHYTVSRSGYPDRIFFEYMNDPYAGVWMDAEDDMSCVSWFEALDTEHGDLPLFSPLVGKRVVGLRELYMELDLPPSDFPDKAPHYTANETYHVFEFSLLDTDQLPSTYRFLLRTAINEWGAHYDVDGYIQIASNMGDDSRIPDTSHIQFCQDCRWSSLCCQFEGGYIGKHTRY